MTNKIVIGLLVVICALILLVYVSLQSITQHNTKLIEINRATIEEVAEQRNMKLDQILATLEDLKVKDQSDEPDLVAPYIDVWNAFLTKLEKTLDKLETSCNNRSILTPNPDLVYLQNKYNCLLVQYTKLHNCYRCHCKSRTN